MSLRTLPYHQHRASPRLQRRLLLAEASSSSSGASFCLALLLQVLQVLLLGLLQALVLPGQGWERLLVAVPVCWRQLA